MAARGHRLHVGDFRLLLIVKISVICLSDYIVELSVFLLFILAWNCLQLPHGLLTSMSVHGNPDFTLFKVNLLHASLGIEHLRVYRSQVSQLVRHVKKLDISVCQRDELLVKDVESNRKVLVLSGHLRQI